MSLDRESPAFLPEPTSVPGGSGQRGSSAESVFTALGRAQRTPRRASGESSRASACRSRPAPRCVGEAGIELDRSQPTGGAPSPSRSIERRCRRHRRSRRQRRRRYAAAAPAWLDSPQRLERIAPSRTPTVAEDPAAWVRSLRGAQHSICPARAQSCSGDHPVGRAQAPAAAPLPRRRARAGPHGREGRKRCRQLQVPLSAPSRPLVPKRGFYGEAPPVKAGQLARRWQSSPGHRAAAAPPGQLGDEPAMLAAGKTPAPALGDGQRPVMHGAHHGRDRAGLVSAQRCTSAGCVWVPSQGPGP